MKVIFLDNYTRRYNKNLCENSSGKVIASEKILKAIEWNMKSIKGKCKFYYSSEDEIQEVKLENNELKFLSLENNNIFDILSNDDSDCMIIQSNVLVSSECIRKLIEERRCYAVFTKNYIDNNLKNMSIKLNNQDYYYGGIIYIPYANLKSVSNLINQSTNLNNENDFMKLLNCIDHNNYLIEENKDILDIHNHKNLSRFILSTKAKTLEGLSKWVKKATILDQISFEVGQWIEKQDEVYQEILKKYKDKFIVIRSSSLNEDCWESSNAGKFESILNIEVNDKEQVYQAINDVINSYQSDNINNQVLIQEYIGNSIMSGVLFTKHIDDLSPYYVITYDDKSGLTDTVTSGTGQEIKNKLILRTNDKIDDFRIQRLIESSKEIENLLEHDNLDIEFIFTDEKLYIVQVRPIAKQQNEETVTCEDVYSVIGEVNKYIDNLMKPKEYISGETTILGNMPDWNPAELIGATPRPLALSLYQKLITNGTWAIAREEIGYKKLGYEQLVYSLAGKPYVDVRKSFNSLLPEGLSDEVSEKIIDYQINKLKENKHLHDKVEFNIVKSIYDFNFETFANELNDDGFKKEEIIEFKNCLNKLTNNIFININESLKIQYERINRLEESRNKIEISKIENKEEIPHLINKLVNDCINNGILPFSILARYAFISMSFLKSLVEKNVINENEYNEILLSIPTVATKFTEDNSLMMNGKISKDEFLDKYGHLRPNTYDINSLNYRAGFDTYFKITTKNSEANESKKYLDIIFEDKKEIINKLLNENNLQFDYKVLREFIKASIPAREWAKFEFTKNINLILELISTFGEKLSLSRDDMSFLNIDTIIALATESHSSSLLTELQELIKSGQRKYSLCQLIKMPSLICNASDIQEFFVEKSNPNFITNKDVTAEVVKLDSSNIKVSEIENKIVAIEYADPGYDWIFGYDIKGLITKYGGVASHMAIRCSEFGIPAAIGCGDIIFNSIQNNNIVELNCENNQIKVIK